MRLLQKELLLNECFPLWQKAMMPEVLAADFDIRDGS